jgi:PAT family beta-lactamase induction signal transducer AmpG
MGFSSGLPLLLTASTLTYRLARAGVDKTSIGLFALVGLPYALKFLRAWALVTQVGLVAAILGLGTVDPAAAPLVTAAFALAVAFCSASQDIAIDAYRIEVLEEHEQGAGAAATQAGYRVGMIVSGAGAIALSDFLGWPFVFGAIAALVSLGAVGVWIGPRPPPVLARSAGSSIAGRSLRGSRAQAISAALDRFVLAPLRTFTARSQWGAILAFALLYKFGDAIAGVMANPFYVDLGFTGVEIASASNVVGVVANLAGVLVGGVFVARTGLVRALAWGGILQAVTNLMFSGLAMIGRDFGMLALAIATDAFAGGLASAAFVALLSSLARGGATATQYALLTSLMAGGRTVMSSGGGWLAAQLSWATFFAVTTLLAVPGLILLIRLARGPLAPAGPIGSATPTA